MVLLGGRDVVASGSAGMCCFRLPASAPSVAGACKAGMTIAICPGIMPIFCEQAPVAEFTGTHKPEQRQLACRVALH